MAVAVKATAPAVDARFESLLLDFLSYLELERGLSRNAGHRAGTENYPAIEAMVTALETIAPRLDEIASIQAPRRDDFAKLINEGIPGTRVVGEGVPRLWNTAMLVMPRHDNRKWLARLSQQGFAISTGSACSSGSEGASQVLQAVGAAR